MEIASVVGLRSNEKKWRYKIDPLERHEYKNVLAELWDERTDSCRGNPHGLGGTARNPNRKIQVVVL
jgi:hypothetical protein